MPWKTLLTLACLAAFLRVPDYLPQFKNYEVLDWSAIPQVLDFTPRRALAPVEEEQERLRPDSTPMEAQNPSAIRGQLDRFYDALARVEAGERKPVRVLHYGDSPTTADMITSDVRSLLQKQFGDAGHGYHLIAKPWAWYEHAGVSVDADGWKIDPANQSSIRDGLYGLGGVSFRGSVGARSQLTFREAIEVSLDLDYLPGSGRVEVLADGESIGVVDTSSGDGHAVVATARPARRFELRVESGTVRLFGVYFFRDVPGVNYSSLGLNGAYISLLSKMFNAKHWAAELQHYRPDLVVINYGTNESVYAEFVDKVFQKELRAAIQRVRAAVPEASILVMSPMDRGQRGETGIVTVPALHRLVTVEQRTAAEMEVAFFNTFEAMGGPGTMGRWYQAEPRLVSADFIHPMPRGARIVGTLLHKALMTGYQKYKTQMMTERYGTKQ